MKKIYHFFAVLTAIFLYGNTNAQIAGTFSVPATYSTIAAAINDLNTQGVNGPVTILVDANYTETAPVGGYTFTATGTAANPIIFQKNGVGSNPQIAAYTGGTATPSSAIQDGIWKFVGSDYITIDGIDLLDQNTSNPATMEYGYGFFKGSATDGCQNNTIKNCDISLSVVNNALGSGPSADGSRGIDVVNALYTSHTTNVIVSSAAGANSNNKFYTNTIRNCNIGIALMGYSATSPFTTADQGNDIGGTSVATGNTINNFGGGGTTAAAGIRTIYQYGINVAYNTINNNNGSGIPHPGVLRGIYLNTATSANASITNNTLTINSGTTTSQVSVIENVSGSSAANNTITIANNLIANGTSSTTSGVYYGIYNSASCAYLNIMNNTFSNNSSNATTGTTYLIYNSGAVTLANKITGNNLSAAFNGTVAYSGTMYNIYNGSSTTTTTLTIGSNNFSNYNHTNIGTGSIYFIYSSSSNNSFFLTNNTWSGLTMNHSGSEFMMYNLSSTQNSLSVTGNSIVTGYNRTAAPGSTYFYYSSASSSGASTHTIANNVVSNVTAPISGSGSFYSFYISDGGTSPYPKKTITNNLVSNINWNSSGTFYGFYTPYLGDGGTGSGSSVFNNTVTNVSTYGFIYSFYGSTPVSPNFAPNVYSNEINNITSSGLSSTVYGAYLSVGSGAGYNFHRNKIYNITQNGSTGTAHGIYISTCSNTAVYNNLVGAISTPSSSGVSKVNGIYIAGGTSINLYYNTVFLNATSSGATFGSNAIYASTTPNVTLKNNIFVNNSTPNGGEYAVAYRRSSSTLSSYNSSSNNNLFYAGTPGANNLIYFDGTTMAQTLSAYQATVVPIDNISVTENPPFASIVGSSPNYLNINTGVGTQIEGWATPISGITTDYALNARNAATPDIGAWEGNYLSSIPSCSGTPAANSVVASSTVICPNTSFNLYLATSYTNSGMSYQWQASPSGSAGTYTNISGAIASAFTPTGITASTWYQAVITCTASGISVTATPVQVTITGNPCQCGAYAASNATSVNDEELFNVSIGTLNNTTNCTQTGGAGSILNEYSNYTGMLAAPSLASGATYSLSVTAGECSGNSYSGMVGVYMDFNQNGTFTDPGENVYTSPYGPIAVAGTTFTSNITVPLTASVGLTRMRVVVVESSVVNPTGTYTWGETEDYCIDILAPVPCGGTPAANSAVASATSVCPNGTVSIGLASTYTVTGITYQWSTATSSVGPYTAVTGGTLSTLTASNLTGPTWYQAVITCTNGNASTTTTPVQVLVNNNPCECASYCNTSLASSTFDEEVFYVSIGTLSNTSTCSQTGGTGSILNRYSNYTGILAAPSLTVGNTYPLTLVGGECNGTSYSGMMAAYIDFNQNGSFTDPGENVFTSPYGPIAVGGSTFGTNVVIPTSAIPGTTRMRVIIIESSAVTPCGGYSWGETEDYCVYIDPGPPCTAANGGFLSNTSYSACNNQSVALTSNSVSLGAGMSYQWMVSTTAGGPYTVVAGGTGSTSPSYTTPALSATNVYYYVLQATCSNASLTGVSNEATVAVNPIPSASVSPVSPICAGQNIALSGSTDFGTNFTWLGPNSFTSNVQNPTITNAPAAAQGNYTLLVSAQNCTATPAIVNVTVNSTNLNIMASPPVICLGNSATLTAVGNPTTLTWSTGATTNSIVVSPSTNTVYSVVGTGTSNCTATVTTTVSVLNPTIAATGTNVCVPGTVATLSATAFGPISWYATSTPTNPLGTGNTFTSNAVTTTTYYAQAVSSSSSTLFTTLAAGNGFSGNMFDVVALNNIDVNGFDMHFSSTGTATVEVWYRLGSFVGFESSNTGWTMAYTTTATALGTGTLTPIPGSFTVSVPAGQTYGFYVTALSSGPQVNYTNGTTLGNVYVQNADAQIKEGKGGGYFSVLNSPRVFNGQMRYTKTGCTSPIVPVVMTVGNGPTVTITPGTGTVCAGGSTGLTASGATTYTWDNGSNSSVIAVTPSVSTTYTVTGDNGGGCLDTATIMISVNPLPTVNLVATQSVACVNGATIGLTGSPAGGAYTGSNVSSGVFTPGSSTGTFMPVYAYSDPVTFCSNSASVTIIVSSCTDLSKNVSGVNGVQVYPNPNTGLFTVESGNGPATVELTDVTGRTILSEKTTGEKLDINILNFANGVYFVKVKTNNGVEVIKVIKE